jgi:hypothetical protein
MNALVAGGMVKAPADTSWVVTSVPSAGMWLCVGISYRNPPPEYQAGTRAVPMTLSPWQHGCHDCFIRKPQLWARITGLT